MWVKRGECGGGIGVVLVVVVKRRIAWGGGGGRIIELISYLKVPTLVQYSTELTLRVTYSVPTFVY